MPITLVTGMPGHGKTLYALELLRTEYKDWNKYVHGIDGLDFDAFNAKDFDPKAWQDLPPNSVCVIDEVHKFYPTRSSHQKPPAYIEDLAEHRHKGIDFLIITQQVWDIDKFVRGRVDRHLHVKRNLGQEFAAIREFQGFHKDAHGEQGRKQALQIKRWKYKPDLYKLYQSATQHTIKKRYPLKLFGMAALIVALLVALVNLGLWAMSFGDDSEAKIAADLESSRGAGAQYEMRTFDAYDGGAALPNTEAWQYQTDLVRANYFTPRIEAVDGLEWTQPIYSEVTKPVTFPKPHCVLIPEDERCICHSQQGTRMGLGFGECKYFAENGFFDPTKPDDELFAQNETPTRLDTIPRTFVETTRAPAGRPDLRRPTFTNWNKRQ